MISDTASELQQRQASPAQDLPRSQIALIFFALLATVTLPLLIFKIPVMADYPNHLARIYAIASLSHDPLLARYYEIDWRLVPDLAVDAIMPLLAQAVGIFTAGKLFVVLTIALLATGPVALYHALYRRIDLWPFTAFLFVYNTDFFFGLLNYLFATAVALWATAVWIRLRERPPLLRAFISLLFILALFFCHFLGIGIYGMAIGCCELRRWYDTPGRQRTLLRDAAVLLLPFLLVLPLTLASPTVGFAQDTLWRLWPDKALGLYFIFKSYSRSLAIAFALVTSGVVLWGFWTKRLHLHPAGMLFAALAAFVYLAMPFKLMSASLVDARLPATFLLFLIGMSRWEQRSATEARRFAAVLLALAALLITEIAGYWAHYQSAIARMEQSFIHIAPGSRVLVAVNEHGADPTDSSILLHLPALVMIERSALYSHAFTHPAKQPLQLKSPYRASAPYDGMPLFVGDLAAADGKPTSAPPVDADNSDRQRFYWTRWRRDYDYLYMLFTPPAYVAPLDGLEPLDAGGVFALYRIDHNESATAGRGGSQD